MPKKPPPKHIFRLPARAAPESMRKGATNIKRYAGRVDEVRRSDEGKRFLATTLWEVISLRPTVFGSDSPDGQWYANILLGGAIRTRGGFSRGTPVDIWTWTDRRGVERVYVESLD